MKTKSKSSFKNTVKKQARELALCTLTGEKKKHSKMDNLSYEKLEMQEYLRDKNINVNQARSLFRFRTRMTRFWENFKGGRPPQQCPECSKALSVATQSHSFECEVLDSNININGNYWEIFETKVNHKVARIVENIEKFRKPYLEK